MGIAIRQQPSHYRLQSTMLMLALVAPWVANLFYVLALKHLGRKCHAQVFDDREIVEHCWVLEGDCNAQRLGLVQPRLVHIHDGDDVIAVRGRVAVGRRPADDPAPHRHGRFFCERVAEAGGLTRFTLPWRGRVDANEMSGGVG